uniref:Uncharacterized protein n=1 Tax=viral metagenome TaxID=1070528 RepID=A0A6C0HYW8_9ZZZZ
MVFTTKLFTRNKQYVCLAMRQSLRNLFDLVQKHNELKREEYEANQRQLVSVGIGTNNRVVVPGYMEMNNPKYGVINNTIYKDLSVMTMFIFTAKRIFLWMYEIFC